MQRPIRKHPRLKDYDYSQDGAYFVTLCSKEKAKIFCRIVGRDDPGAPPCTQLTDAGRVVDKYIQSIPTAYKDVELDKYVVMPNHIHLLLSISAPSGAPRSSRPTISRVIGALKRFTNKDADKDLWQTTFHDHIIRDEQDYLACWQYINDNPAKWTEDKYFV